MTSFELLASITTFAVAAISSAWLTWAIKPLLMRYALAKPNARSSHRVPTPQGAGIAVIISTLTAAGVAIASVNPNTSAFPIIVFGATLFIALLGAADDIKPIPVLPRLFLQSLAVGAVLYATSTDVRMFPVCPLWIERGVLFLAGLWFVNLVNFMDGLDWMTVAEVIPVTGALLLLGWIGNLPPSAAFVAAALGGAILGFAPFNRPVAKIFLGDVGSLPIGLLLGWCLLELASRQQLAAAMLLPLYYISDATLTLLLRLKKGEPVWAAHRSHFYQRATDNGFTVLGIVGHVFTLNIGLAALAIASVATTSLVVKTALFLAGAFAVSLTMHSFSRPR